MATRKCDINNLKIKNEKLITPEESASITRDVEKFTEDFKNEFIYDLFLKKLNKAGYQQAHKYTATELFNPPISVVKVNPSKDFVIYDEHGRSISGAFIEKPQGIIPYYRGDDYDFFPNADDVEDFVYLYGYKYNNVPLFRISEPNGGWGKSAINGKSPSDDIYALTYKDLSSQRLSNRELKDVLAKINSDTYWKLNYDTDMTSSCLFRKTDTFSPQYLDFVKADDGIIKCIRLIVMSRIGHIKNYGERESVVKERFIIYIERSATFNGC